MTDNYNCSWCNEHAIPGFYTQGDIPGRFCSPACRSAAVEESLRGEIKRLEGEVEMFEGMKEGVTIRISDMQKKIRDLQEANDNLLKDIKNLEDDIGPLETEIARLMGIGETPATAAPSVNFPPDHSPADIADQILNEEEENDE